MGSNPALFLKLLSHSQSSHRACCWSVDGLSGGRNRRDPLPKHCSHQPPSSAEDFWWLCISYKRFFFTWNLCHFFIWPRDTQPFLPTTALQDGSCAQGSYSPSPPQWGHLLLFILFLSPELHLSTPSVHSDTSWSSISSLSLPFQVFPVFHLRSCYSLFCMYNSSWCRTKNSYYDLTFLVLLFKSIHLISKHLCR